jgi:REP element-mobilizing transposase RayT
MLLARFPACTFEGLVMVRSIRLKSEHGIYHVMLRGLNQAQLFYDDEDYEAFLTRLCKYKEQYSFQLFAYCLLGNHVHLLFKERDWTLSDFIKSVTVSYAHWFNRKYDRSGYLFQGRYRSEPVDSTDYLYTVLRYIHNNPVMIGESIAHWTSYDEYVNKNNLVDTQWVLSTLDEDSVQAKLAFKKLMRLSTDSKEPVLSAGKPKALKDSQAIEMMNRS